MPPPDPAESDLEPRAGEPGGDRGEVAGGRPPLRPRAVAVAWSLLTAALAIAVLAVIGTPGPGDDPDPARQRPGLLIDAEDARVVPSLEISGDPLGRRPVLLIFDRRGHDPERLSPVLARLPAGVALVLVAPQAGGGAASAASGVKVVADPGKTIAGAVGLHAPRDGGFPTGYALIDGERRVRYVTLDPGYAEHALEIHIVAEALSS